MRLVALIVATAACVHPSGAAAPAPDPEAAAEKDAIAALAAGRYDDALARLAPFVDDAKQGTRVAYFRATALLYQKDFAGATRVFEDRVDQARAQGDHVTEAWLHNALTWVRWATGDHAGALAENAAVATAVADPSVSADDRREAMEHYLWDRAYLFAEDPSARADADAARRAYEDLADPRRDHDGLAVLAAFFAVIDHDGKAALAAAQQVDPAEDSDLQDLYVLALAHDAGGDHAGADQLRAMIRRGDEYPMKPILLQRLRFDASSRASPTPVFVVYTTRMPDPNQPAFELEKHGITVKEVYRNASPAFYYESALRNERGSAISSTGALIAYSGKKTGRSPTDKRIVDEVDSHKDVWWGNVNIKLDPSIFVINRERAIDYLNTRERLYVVDGFAGWDPKYRLKIRIICARAYHALFMHNMLIRPTAQQLAEFGEPDYVIYNAGQFPANRHTAGMTSQTSIDLSFGQREFVILGSEYAGEMKKGVFTIMNYLMPKQGVLSMHCSATAGKDGDTSILFGLSGTGKTTLSADPKRLLIGDDEHCWSDEGIFNIEGGCYAKVIDLSREQEPDIWNALKFGAVLENVVYEPESHLVDYRDVSITQNTRGSYVIDDIPNAKIPCVGGHPKNVIFLTCDAFGVLPPVSKLTPSQAMYHFISGYTAKVAGTEVGVKDPEATFSPCFGGPFLVWHPGKYAEMLSEKLKKHGAQTWLVNTGWSGGGYGVGARMKLRFTRAIVDAIHSGALHGVKTVEDPVFGLQVPTSCPDVPPEILIPRQTWADKAAYDEKAKHVASLFRTNFKKYEAGVSDEVRAAGPRL